MPLLFLISFISAVVVLRATAFAVIPTTTQPRLLPAAVRTRPRCLLASTTPPSPSSATPSSANFEYQEMRIILDAMLRQGISDLASPGKEDLERYVRSVARSTSSMRSASSSSSPTSSLHNPSQLVGTTWRLAYSNDLSSLPPDATVYLQFLSERDMEYQLKFGPRTLGLNAIAADCPWQLTTTTTLPSADSISSSGSSASQLTFVYDKIKMDAFGLKNIGTGLFGMLQGRSQTIHTAYFDGDYWIDLGNPLEGGSSITVYVKVEDLDSWRN